VEAEKSRRFDRLGRAVRPQEGGHRGRRRWLGVALVLVTCVCAGFAFATGAFGRLTLGAAATQSNATRPSAIPAQAAPSPTATPDRILQAAQAIVAPATPPTRLLIPTIGVNAAVESVQLDAQGNMAIPARTDEVAWYSPGAAPGEVGNAVIDGHLDWYNGPAVFWKLGSLRPGDALTVQRADGSQKTFKVDSTTLMGWDAPTDSLFTRSGPPTLTLITCAGAWDRQKATYTKRLVVHASLSTDPTYPPAG
jgi:LPXTG-site transpeptidase (sortase) family protein